MNDYTIYRGTGIQASQEHDLHGFNLRCSKAKCSETHFTRRAGVLPSQFKGKTCTLSLNIIIEDSSCYLIFMIL